MDTMRVEITTVERGSLAPSGSGGAVVLDTLSGDERGAFWHDRSGGRHYADGDGRITVYRATVRTDAIGESAGKDGARHALSFADKPICPNGRRSRTLTVWQSGTALASVTCESCRAALNLAPVPARQSAGI